MSCLLKRWQGAVASGKALPLLLLLAALLHIGSSIGGHFYADDYVQRAYATGSEALQQRGLLAGMEPGSFTAFIRNQFNFFNPASDNYAAMQAFGMVPWWAGEDAMLHFFRPLAAATHYLDYRLWPDSPRLMHCVSLLWYVLGLAVIYRLYRAVRLEKQVALLALLLVMLDVSVFQVVTWIASRSMLMVIAIGFFAVYAYHRSITSRGWYAIALLALLLSLLSAEGAIGICAYLGAYMLTLDARRWWQRIAHIAPFALITVIWHVAYQQAGFGAYGVDFYLDPGREPALFLQTALYRLPGNFFELASGVDFMSGQLRPDLRQLYFAIGGLATLAAFLWLLWPQLKTDKTLRFFLLGSVFALVPGLTIALAPRVMILPNVGFAVLLATVMLNAAAGVWQGGRRYLGKAVLYYAVLFHVLLALVLATLMNVKTISAALDQDKPQGYVELGVDDMAGKYIVAVNSLQPFWLAFIAHQLDYNRQPLPLSVRLLASSFYPLTLTRLNENQLLLEGHPAIQLDRAALDALANKEQGHFIYLTWQLMGLIRSEREPWQAGWQFDAQEMSIRVQSLENGKPRQLLITLHKPLTEYRWIYQDIEQRRYLPLSLPEPGNTVHFKGVFNGTAPVTDDVR